MSAQKAAAGRLVTMGVALGIVVIALASLMPTLQTARVASQKRSSAYDRGRASDLAGAMTGAPETEATYSASQIAPPPAQMAVVKKFDAEISLTPKLSVGTATPESIYVAEFSSTIEARSPTKGGDRCQIELPLPPKIISLADVDVTVNGEPNEDFVLARGHLIWHGRLEDEQTSEITVAYSATGKGVYTLEKPPGTIIDLFKIKLTANKSDIRMLQLSLQPSSLEGSSDKTTYTWEYKRLVVAQPIAVDVLGIAATDRLGKLTWLGPVSVLAFGILTALVAFAHDPEKLNGWVLVFVVGCFASGYPLMYFLQDSVSLPTAMGLAALMVIGVVAWRTITLFGLRQGVFGGVLLPGVLMGMTLAATVTTRSAMQGVLLTIMAIFSFVVAMIMLPRAQANLPTATAQTAPPAPPPDEPAETE